MMKEKSTFATGCLKVFFIIFLVAVIAFGLCVAVIRNDGIIV